MTNFLPRRRHVVSAVASLAFVGVLAVVSAQQAQTAVVVPTGRLLASNCFQCHGTNGQNGSISALACIGAADFFNNLAQRHEIA